MRYELMRPHQIREAIEKNLPVALPLGVLEYHGEHLPVGVDTLHVIRVLEILEQEFPLVILPPFYYGAGSYVVEPPAGNGTFQIDPDGLIPFAKQLFSSLLRVGFRNVHAFIHHQTENFVAGMPTDLSFKMAGRQATFAFLDKERGEGWWGDNKMAAYYEEHAEGDNPFNWIQIHALMDDAIIQQYAFDHAGKGETSTMLALCPETVDMDKLDTSKWYLATAKDASKEYGETGRDLVLERLRKVLNQGDQDHRLSRKSRSRPAHAADGRRRAGALFPSRSTDRRVSNPPRPVCTQDRIDHAGHLPDRPDGCPATEPGVLHGDRVCGVRLQPLSRSLSRTSSEEHWITIR